MIQLVWVDTVEHVPIEVTSSTIILFLECWRYPPIVNKASCGYCYDALFNFFTNIMRYFEFLFFGFLNQFKETTYFLLVKCLSYIIPLYLVFITTFCDLYFNNNIFRVVIC